MMTREDFVGALRAALMQLDDFSSLRNSPLLPLLCPSAHSPSPVALQERLIAVIRGLRYATSANTQRYYEVLHYRYVEHLSQSDVAFQLGISERQLRREQTNAIELLAEHLWRDNEAAEDTAENPMPASGRTEEQELIHSEMDWLRQQLTRGSCQVEEALLKSLLDVTALAENYEVRITHQVHPEVGSAAVPLLALRQSLLTVLTALVPKVTHQALHLTARRTGAEVQIRIELAETGKAVDEVCANHVQIAHQILSPFGGRVRFGGSLQPDSPPSHVALRFPTVNSVPVLVVDDNPDATGLLQRYAQDSRFHVLTTNNGLETLRLACEDKVRAILLDIMMPEIDGWDLLAELRHHPTTQHIPVAICSVLPHAELSAVLGARMFIQKPLSQESFLRALDVLTSESAGGPR